jgi:hypothetical protein
LLITNDNTDILSSLRWLGVSVRVQVTYWQDNDYLEMINRLRPPIIVTEAAAIDWASEYAVLIAALITTYRPTIVSLAPLAHELSSVYCIAHQIGAGTGVRLNSLDELIFEVQ